MARTLLSLVVALAVPSLATAQTTTFFEGGVSSWVAALSITVGAGSSTSPTFISAGGNPGDAIELTLAIPPSGTASVAAEQLFLNAAAQWDPSTAGAITQLTMSVDHVAVVSAGQGHAVYLALQQGGRVYIAPGQVTFAPTSWQTMATRAFTQEDFTEVDPQLGALRLRTGSHPDFTTSGRSLALGLWVGMSNAPGVPNAVSRTQRYDNWRVVVAHTNAANYPGTRDGLLLTTAVGSSPPTGGPGYDDKTVSTGSVVSVVLPGRNAPSTLWGAPLFVFAQIMSGPPAPPIPGLELWANPWAPLSVGPPISGGLILVDGLSGNPFAPVLSPVGNYHAFVIPTITGLAGQTMYLQAAAFSPRAANGVVALTNAQALLFR